MTDTTTTITITIHTLAKDMRTTVNDYKDELLERGRDGGGDAVMDMIEELVEGEIPTDTFTLATVLTTNLSMMHRQVGGYGAGGQSIHNMVHEMIRDTLMVVAHEEWEAIETQIRTDAEWDRAETKATNDMLEGEY